MVWMYLSHSDIAYVPLIIPSLNSSQSPILLRYKIKFRIHTWQEMCYKICYYWQCSASYLFPHWRGHVKKVCYASSLHLKAICTDMAQVTGSPNTAAWVAVVMNKVKWHDVLWIVIPYEALWYCCQLIDSMCTNPAPVLIQDTLLYDHHSG